MEANRLTEASRPIEPSLKIEAWCKSEARFSNLLLLDRSDRDSVYAQAPIFEPEQPKAFDYLYATLVVVPLIVPVITLLGPIKAPIAPLTKFKPIVLPVR